MDALVNPGQSKVHIAIDPYGNIEYEHKEKDFVRLNYTNEMRDECLADLYNYARHIKQSFLFFNLEDTEFFNLYRDGVPVYNQFKAIENKYSFVHFDGPHAIEPLMIEICFFLDRANKGTCWVFDDIEGYYDHDKIEQTLFKYGFKLIEKTKRKALYQYEG
jgi:hypothetical protein